MKYELLQELFFGCQQTEDQTKKEKELWADIVQRGAQDSPWEKGNRWNAPYHCSSLMPGGILQVKGRGRRSSKSL